MAAMVLWNLCHTRNHAAIAPGQGQPATADMGGSTTSSSNNSLFLPPAQTSWWFQPIWTISKIAKSNQIICPMIGEQIDKLLKPPHSKATLTRKASHRGLKKLTRLSLVSPRSSAEILGIEWWYCGWGEGKGIPPFTSRKGCVTTNFSDNYKT